MSPVEIIAIAVALAMDAFAVSIAAGVTLCQVSARQTFRLAWHFGLFQAMMPVVGWGAGRTVEGFISAFDHWVAFVLLGFIGGRMILGALRNEPEQVKCTEPTKGWSLVVLSVATSIDALAVGLSLAMLRVPVWVPTLVIGLVAGVFTAVGIQIGGYFGRRLPVARYAELFGGVVLLIIGVRILHEHGVL
ncbi:MAG: manganese efflux pump MntP family protein [Desulfofustis sp.]|jgi:putative Mn2+ efflux pump MntP|nr:manganese efflux pump MntP family protein [Desulfofustis sp.]